MAHIPGIQKRKEKKGTFLYNHSIQSVRLFTALGAGSYITLTCLFSHSLTWLLCESFSCAAITAQRLLLRVVPIYIDSHLCSFWTEAVLREQNWPRFKTTARGFKPRLPRFKVRHSSAELPCQLQSRPSTRITADVDIVWYYTDVVYKYIK